VNTAYAESAPAAHAAGHLTSNPARERRDSVWRVAENLGLTLLLGAMIVLPLIEIGLRQFSAGIPSAPEFLRHLTLLVGMLGGAIAAREGRLLALASGPALLRGGWRRAADAFASAASAAISALLCAASLRFVLQERLSGGTMAYGIPLWPVQLVMPLAFGAIALRTILRSAATLRGRTGMLALAAAVGVAGAQLPTGFALGGLLLATALGAPIFAAIGGAALILLWGSITTGSSRIPRCPRSRCSRSRVTSWPRVARRAGSCACSSR
jgi:C4-dicarboxylate transporter DctM subunit